MQSLKKKKWIVALISTLTAMTCFSVGFASWVIPVSGDNVTLDGDIVPDGVYTPIIPGEYRHVITIDEDSLTEFGFSAGHGFVKDGAYANNIDLSGTCTFSSEDASECFAKYKDDEYKTFMLDFELTTGLSGGFYSNNFVSDSIVLESSNFTTQNKNPNDGVSISTTFTLACFDNENDFIFTFNINLKWTGSSLSNFPDLSSAGIGINLWPKEVSA